jgi:Fic family protein
MKTSGENSLYGALGFTWDRSAVRHDAVVHDVPRATWRFRRTLPEYVWDAAVLEGNPFTYPEVQTLLDGVTVGGRKLSDEQQVLNLAEAANELYRLVFSDEFRLDKPTSDRMNLLIARDEAIEAGLFRGEGKAGGTPRVRLGPNEWYEPPPTEPGGANLRRIHQEGLEALAAVADVFEQAIAYFLFGALMQFYFDGNKRTSRYVMAGWLMSHGIDAISIPAGRRQEFNTEMIRFYRAKDGTGMFAFMASCYDDWG